MCWMWTFLSQWHLWLWHACYLFSTSILIKIKKFFFFNGPFKETFYKLWIKSHLYKLKQVYIFKFSKNIFYKYIKSIHFLIINFRFRGDYYVKYSIHSNFPGEFVHRGGSFSLQLSHLKFLSYYVENFLSETEFDPVPYVVKASAVNISLTFRVWFLKI